MIDVDQLKKHVFDVIGAIQQVSKTLGPGLNEYCYQEALQMELAMSGIKSCREMTFHPTYRGQMMKSEFRVDFICKEDVIVECKAVMELIAIHRAQLFNYMRLLQLPCGILANFLPSIARIERYFYDRETREIVDVNGHVVRSFY